MEAWQEARLAFEETLRLKPDYDAARHASIEVYQELGLTQEAVKILEEGIRISPDYWQFYFALGDIYLQQLDRPNAAIPIYRKGLQLNPSWAKGYGVLASSYMRIGNPSEAIHYYEKAQELAADLTGLEFNLAMAYLLNGDIHRGTQAMAALTPHDPEAMDFYLTWLDNAGSMYVGEPIKQGDIGKALNLVEPLLSPIMSVPMRKLNSEKVAQSLMLLAIQYRPIMDEYDVLEGYDVVIYLFELATQLDESNSGLRRYLAVMISNKGRYYNRRERYREGLTWAEKSIEVDNTYDDGWMTAFVCHSKLGNKHDCIYCAEQAARLGNAHAVQFLRQIGRY